MTTDFLSLAPPFSPENTTRIPDGFATRRLIPGSVLIVRASSGVTDAEQFERQLLLLRCWSPASPIVVSLPATHPKDAYVWVRKAWNAGVRGMLLDEAPSGSSLRPQLTDTMGMGLHVALWTSTMQQRELAVRSALEHIVDDAVCYANVQTLIESAGECPRTWRDRFERAQLPGPGCWFRVARALHACLQLQRNNRLSISAVALQLGYSDASTFSRQCIELFGARPTALRALLGWEPLLATWYKQHSRMTKTATPRRISPWIAAAEAPQ